MTSELRDALAAALTSFDWSEVTVTAEVTTPADAPNRVYESSVDADAFAARILSDPAFRAALVEAVAEALQEDCDADSCVNRDWSDHGPHDFQAEFVVDYLLGGEAYREAHAETK